MTEAPLSDLIAADGPRRGWIVRTSLLALSIVCFVLGVIFWLVPVVTGIPFYIAAVALLGLSSRRFARWINACERRLPHRHRVRIRKLLRRPTNA